MSLQRKYLRILSAVAPLGAAGVSLLLGSTTPVTASPEPGGSQPRRAREAGVAERLAAIRDAVSAVAGREAAPNGEDISKLRLAWGNWWNNWGWRPWGWGWPNWNNWHNWNNWPNWWRNF